MTENGTTRDLLLSNIHELKDSLLEQGVKLGKLDVQINYGFDQSSPGSKEGLKERQRQNHPFNAAENANEEINSIEDSLSALREMVHGNTMLHVVA
jgi:flagellar hook-length control protein FliK